MKSKNKNHSILFLLIGIIVGIILMSLKNSKKVLPQPVEIPVSIGDVAVNYIVNDIGSYNRQDISGILYRITRDSINEHPEDIRGCIEDKLEDLMYGPRPVIVKLGL